MAHSMKYCNQNVLVYLREALLSRTNQFFDIYRGFFSGLHLAVGRHHRRRIPRYPQGLQLGRVKVFLADHVIFLPALLLM